MFSGRWKGSGGRDGQSRVGVGSPHIPDADYKHLETPN